MMYLKFNNIMFSTHYDSFRDWADKNCIRRNSKVETCHACPHSIPNVTIVPGSYSKSICSMGFHYMKDSHLHWVDYFCDDVNKNKRSSYIKGIFDDVKEMSEDEPHV